MSYKQTTPTSAGWPTTGQQVGMWPTQQHAPIQTMPYGATPMPPTPAVLQEFYRNRLLSTQTFDRNLMGPPPVPQKLAANGNLAQGHQLLGQGFAGHPMVGSRGGYPAPMNDVSPASGMPRNDIPPMPARPHQMPPDFSNKTSFSSKYPQYIHGSETPSMNPHQSLADTKERNSDLRPSLNADNLWDAGIAKVGNDRVTTESIVPNIDNTESQLGKLLGNSNSSNGHRSWNPKPIQMTSNMPAPTLHDPSIAPANSTPAPQRPAPQQCGPSNDLQNVLASLLSSSNSDSPTSSESTPPHSGRSPLPGVMNLSPTNTPPQSNGGLPGFLLPSMTSAQLVNDGDQMEDGSDKDKPKRRRRKRCGSCGPCKVPEDCGDCYVCRNKGQVNAICKLRKCLVLRKKVLSKCPLKGHFSSCFVEHKTAFFKRSHWL